MTDNGIPTDSIPTDSIATDGVFTDGIGQAPGRASADAVARSLADVHADLGRRIVALSSSQDGLAAITAVALESVTGADHASITRGRNARFETLAPTDTTAQNADRLQYELNSGPCVDSVDADGPFLVPDLATDERWPVYGPQAAARFGIGSMLSIRMVLDDDVQASLNLYSDKVGGFTPRSQTIALVLTTHGAVAVSTVMARERAKNLEKALVNSRHIGMAIGVLMSARKLTGDQAFALLKIASQRANRKLALIAQDVIDTGTLDIPDR